MVHCLSGFGQQQQWARGLLKEGHLGRCQQLAVLQKGPQEIPPWLARRSCAWKLEVPVYEKVKLVYNFNLIVKNEKGKEEGQVPTSPIQLTVTVRSILGQ